MGGPIALTSINIGCWCELCRSHAQAERSYRATRKRTQQVTRINVVPVEELCDQHLLAEHRELTRIPNCIAKGRYSLKGQPSEYTLGTGHVKFFYDKLSWLDCRYHQLHNECLARGFNPSWKWPESYDFPHDLCKDYEVTDEALSLNRGRIQERLEGFQPRWTSPSK